jgi:predicted PurR-regulated permease PerM
MSGHTLILPAVERRRPILRGRLRRRDRAGATAGDEFVEIEPSELTRIFAAPGWLRDLGFSAWLLVGVAAAVAGAVWFLSLTQTIVVPVITAAIIASVASPVVDWLKKHSVPRGAGAAIVFVAIIAIGVAVGVIVLAGIAGQADSLSAKLQAGANEIEAWARDLGVDSTAAHDAKDGASASVSAGFKALTEGLAAGIDRLASLAVFLTFTALSLFFMLKDAPTIGAFVERHLGVPAPVARTITSRTTSSLRGYFAGVTIVAAFSAVVVGVGALALGVPLAGTIAVVTFVGGYVPYIGAWTAGSFAVLIALGSEGATTAVALAIVVLLANGALQQLVQPIAYGATLGIHPLAVLIVTIAGGALFGTIGLVLAAPLTAAAVKISADLARARAREEEQESPPPGAPPEAEPAPSG